jgi:hypothetical protein
MKFASATKLDRNPGEHGAPVQGGQETWDVTKSEAKKGFSLLIGSK